MKYFRCEVMVGIPEEDYASFSEHADVTFAIANKVHDPDNDTYLLNHSYEVVCYEKVEELKYSVITKEGGI